MKFVYIWRSTAISKRIKCHYGDKMEMLIYFNHSKPFHQSKSNDGYHHDEDKATKSIQPLQCCHVNFESHIQSLQREPHLLFNEFSNCLSSISIAELGWKSKIFGRWGTRKWGKPLVVDSPMNVEGEKIVSEKKRASTGDRCVNAPHRHHFQWVRFLLRMTISDVRTIFYIICQHSKFKRYVPVICIVFVQVDTISKANEIWWEFYEHCHVGLWSKRERKFAALYTRERLCTAGRLDWFFFCIFHT